METIPRVFCNRVESDHDAWPRCPLAPCTSNPKKIALSIRNAKAADFSLAAVRAAHYDRS